MATVTVDGNSIMAALKRIESKQEELFAKIDKLEKRPSKPLTRLTRVTSPKNNMDEGWDSEALAAARKPLTAIGASESVDVTNRPEGLHRRKYTFDDDDDIDKKGEGVEHMYSAMGWKRQIVNAFTAPEGADCITRFAFGPVWTLLSITVIMINTVVIGVEMELSTNYHIAKAMHLEGTSTQESSIHYEDKPFDVLEKCFLAWFIFEVLVNLYAQRKDFFCGQDWFWNAFDVLVVTTAIFLQIYEFANVGFLRVVRLLRLGRMLRAFRVFKFLRGIRSMLISISGSMLHLFSAMLLMSVFMYTVSLVFIQSISAETEPGGELTGTAKGNAANPRELTVFSSFEDGDTLLQKFHIRYGGVGRTMMTLFMTISGGLEWREAAAPMVELGWIYAVLWTCYIMFMIFGMLNVLTGIFVDAAFQAMNNDRDNIIQTQLEEKHSLINTIRTVFQESDDDGSGQVSLEEFQTLLKNQEMKAYLDAIGIDSSEAHGLFRLLDDDGSGTVSVDEFVTGLLRVKGSAKAVDMVMLLYENRKISKKLSRIFRQMRSVNDVINHLAVVGDVPDTDVGI